MKKSERGAALLSVLLLVAVMAVLAASALERLKLSTALAANGAALDQARAYGHAAETLALIRIGDLAARDPARTTLAGNWNGQRFNLPIPGGIATARVRDGGNCFNLNSVAQGQVPTQLNANPAGIAQFAALMEVLQVERDVAARVAAALADWVDADTVPAPGGAEDDYYRGLAVPYMAANAWLEDVSELRAVAGVTPELYARIRPWICALPVAALSPINVNTLTPEQAPLLAMLLEGRLDVPRARAIIENRPPNGWSALNDFWAQPALTQAGIDVRTQTKLRTDWFALDIAVELGGAELQETALIDAAMQPARLVSRQWGDPS